MKAIVDAQLPRRISSIMSSWGWDVLHTLDLPGGNRTSDADIAAFADSEDRWVISKDADFIHGHLIRRSPKRLLTIATGNVSNADLAARLTEARHEIENTLSDRLVLTKEGLIEAIPLL